MHFDIISLYAVLFLYGYVYLWIWRTKNYRHIHATFAQTIGYSYIPTIDIKTLDAKLFTLGTQRHIF